MVAPKPPLPPRPGAVLKRAKHEHGQGGQRGQEADAVADAVGDLFAERLRAMSDSGYNEHGFHCMQT